MVPSVFWGREYLDPQYAIIDSNFTIFTHQFLHGGTMHMVSNMIILWVFGDNIEEALGRVPYLAFYIVGGACGGYLHATMVPNSNGPLIGASGAISAVGAAYLMMHPRAKIWILAFWYFPVKIPVWIPVGAWIIYQLYEGLQDGDSGIAWWAHVGGFAFGLAYILAFKRRMINDDLTKWFKKAKN